MLHAVYSSKTVVVRCVGRAVRRAPAADPGGAERGGRSVHRCRADRRSRRWRRTLDRRCAPALLGSRRATTTRGCDDEPPIPFRYGDYRPIRRRYLPPDYREDAAPYVVDEVGLRRSRMGSARSGRRDALHRRRCAASTGLPTRRGGAGLARPRRRAARARAAGGVPVRAQRPPQAARQSRRPSDACAGRHGRSRMARGLSRSWRRNGLRFDLQTPWWHLREAARLARRLSRHADHPQPHRPAGRSQRRRASPAGSARWRALAACPNVAVKISGLGQPRPSRGRRRPTATSCSPSSICSASQRCMFASNFPVDSLCATFATIFDGFREIVARLRRRASSGRCSATTRSASTRWMSDEPPATRIRRRRPDGPADGQAPGVARLSRSRAYDIVAGTARRRERGRRARGSVGRPTRRATPTSCCSTCRRPRRSRPAVFGDDGVGERADAAAARRRFLDDQGRQGQARSRRGLRETTGCGWIDAPVSGGPPASGSGTLTVMAGGEAADIARVAPLMARRRRALHAYGSGRAAGSSPR